MKLYIRDGIQNPYVANLHDKITMTIQFDKGDLPRVQELADKLRELSNGEIDIEVRQHKEKRSLDSNAKCWLLIGKMAKVMGLTPIEVYRHEIQDMPTYDILPVRNDAVDRFRKNWESQGTGWICDSLGASKFPNYTNLKCHYGSSTFNTKEMSDFIDKIIMDCKELGIQTDSPDEIERMKQLWGDS